MSAHDFGVTVNKDMTLTLTHRYKPNGDFTIRLDQVEQLVEDLRYAQWAAGNPCHEIGTFQP